jgi:hypothetical protein
MRSPGRIEEADINVQSFTIDQNSPPELAAQMLEVAGQVRLGKVVDGARLVAILRAGAAFLE